MTEQKIMFGAEDGKIIIACVMCGKQAKFSAEAKYKSGTIKEALCAECAKINQGIEQEKWRYDLK